MCKCTPNKRTPFCGKPGCEWPEQKNNPKPKLCPYCKQSVSNTDFEKTPAKILFDFKQERDRAIGAILLLVYDDVISLSRCAELLGMSLIEIRDECRRLEYGDENVTT